MSSIASLLKSFTQQLQNQDISTARLDSLILLEDATGKDRTWLLANQKVELTAEQIEELSKKIERRANHEPLAYIRGKSAFYGREFFVNEHTLQPRPETETMVELLLDIAKSKKLKVKSVIDVGTGSGCLAITAKLELPDIEVHATDISSECLRVAKKNARSLNADVTFHKANLIEPADNHHFFVDRRKSDDLVLCCNLPYVPEGFTINQAAMFEPDIAIFGGEDGLDYYRQLFAQIQSRNTLPSALLAESLPTQHSDLEKLARSFNYELRTTSDFIQLFMPVQ